MKKALNESTVRKFMKLANIGGLTENFVDKTMKEEEEALEETLEETEEVTEEVESLEEMGAELDELPPEDMGAALESVTGVEINVDSAGGGEEVELDAEEEGGEEELLDTAEDALDEPAGEESLEEWDEVEEALNAADVSLEEKFNQEAFINEVTKRVAKRLLSLSKKR